MRVLLVDDDDDILIPLQIALQREGYDVVSASDGTLAWELFEKERPDFAVFDVSMPGIDGVTLMRKVREAGEPYVPIILLTGRAEEPHRVMALNLGADDYLIKPCSHRELIARIRAVWRRARPPDPIVNVGALSIDPSAHVFSVDGRAVAITAQEFVLLRVLMGQAGQVVRTSSLMKQVWGGEVSHDLLRVTIYRLRRKIEPDPQHPRFLHTVAGVGFMVSDAAATVAPAAEKPATVAE